MNTTLKGDLFERRAYEIIQKAVVDQKLGLLPANCRIFQKKAYHSKERDSNIIFDLSIEVWLDDAEQFHLLYLIECKDYSSPVPINDVEKFVSHIRQVSGVNAKGVFVTTKPLQKAALNYARSQGVMLIEVSPENKSNIILHNKNRKGSQLIDTAVAPWTTQADKIAEINDTFNTIPSGSDWDEIIKTFLKAQLSSDFSWGQPGEEVIGLDRLSQQLIEEITANTINDFDPSFLCNWKALSMESFIPYFEKRFDVKIITNETIPVYNGKKLNGYCDFENKEIHIDKSLETGQFPFVCAHEMGHFVLHMKLKMTQQV